MKKEMKKLITTATFIFSSLAIAGGEGATNGGDNCEFKIKAIAQDIKQWLKDDGAANLIFTSDDTVSSFRTKMIESLESNVSISCVDESLFLKDTQKTCLNYESTIKCDFQRFMDLPIEDQYILIHHEYAGLAGIEMNTGDSSDYFYSNQISLYLEEKRVKKLTIKKSKLPDLEMVSVSPGEFIMHYSENYYHSPGEDEHKVKITRPYQIQKNEVTQALYFEVMGKNPAFFKNKEHCPDSWVMKESKEYGFSKLCPHHPVESVSKKEIETFIKKLNQRTGEKYRLPTEAEWEFAARGGRQTEYFFGDDETLVDTFIVYLGTSKTTMPVGKYRKTLNTPNPIGMYDVNGNVMEIVADSYTSYSFIPTEEILVDPFHFKDYEDTLGRGGSFESNAYQSRLAHRVRWYRDNDYKDAGFRLAK